MSASGRLVLLTREDCGLCETFLEELQAYVRQAGSIELPPLELQDVDSDPETRRRYGLHIPVLLLDGERVCAHRFDPAELTRLIRPR